MVAAKGGKRVGYIRVSALDQNTERQLDGIELDKRFTDKASGKDTKRPQLQAALDYLREGDVLVVHSIDRLARNVRDLLRIVEELNARNVGVEFITERLEFTGADTPMAKLQLTMMAAFAAFERAISKERQREGIAIAKTKGVYTGRKPVLTPQQAKELQRRAKMGDTKAALAKEFGVSRASVYNYARQ